MDREAKEFSRATGKAKIYVVRPSVVGGRYLWDIQFDGKHAGLLAEHTYLLLVVPPGQHEVSVLAGEDRHSLAVAASPGENCFVEVVAKLAWTESRAMLRVLPREQGEAAVRNSKLAELL